MKFKESKRQDLSLGDNTPSSLLSSKLNLPTINSNKVLNSKSSRSLLHSQFSNLPVNIPIFSPSGQNQATINILSSGNISEYSTRDNLIKPMGIEAKLGKYAAETVFYRNKKDVEKMSNKPKPKGSMFINELWGPKSYKKMLKSTEVGREIERREKLKRLLFDEKVKALEKAFKGKHPEQNLNIDAMMEEFKNAGLNSPYLKNDMDNFFSYFDTSDTSVKLDEFPKFLLKKNSKVSDVNKSLNIDTRLSRKDTDNSNFNILIPDPLSDRINEQDTPYAFSQDRINQELSRDDIGYSFDKDITISKDQIQNNQTFDRKRKNSLDLILEDDTQNVQELLNFVMNPYDRPIIPSSHTSVPNLTTPYGSLVVRDQNRHRTVIAQVKQNCAKHNPAEKLLNDENQGVLPKHFLSSKYTTRVTPNSSKNEFREKRLLNLSKVNSSRRL